MAGIVAYGAYIPWYRLGSHTRGWTGRIERAVANFDEDTITMAVAAIRDCLRDHDRDRVDNLYLGSTTAPYSEKQSASLVATASDLRPNIFTMDVAHSLRSGSMALRIGLDSVDAGRTKTALVVASDLRAGEPGSDIEQNGGDGSAALLLGSDEEAIVHVRAVHSVVNEILDVWRADGETEIRTAPDHFRYPDGYIKAAAAGVSGLLEQSGFSLDDFDSIILPAPDLRRHRAAVSELGLDPARVQKPLLDGVGSSGAAQSLMQLIAALEKARVGQRLLLIGVGDGADAMVLETTPALEAFQRSARRGIAKHLQAKASLDDYDDYLRWRRVGPGSTKRGQHVPAPHALHREQDAIYRFHGVQCQNCGMVQYPPQRICLRCHTQDRFDPIPLADSKASLFTYSLDYGAGTQDTPLVRGIVDFASGGRTPLTITDRDVTQIQIGMELELTFRKLQASDGVHNYYWKAQPPRC